MKIIVVSDTHLGFGQADSDAFGKFIDDLRQPQSEETHLVLLGDIFDFWRSQNLDAVLNYGNILEKILQMTSESTKVRTYYLIGNHDYAISRLKERLGMDFPFLVSHMLRLENGKHDKFFFIHGYEFEVIANFEPMTVEEYEKVSEELCDRTNGIIGNILSRLWDVGKIVTKFDNDKHPVHSLMKPPQERSGMSKTESMSRSLSARALFLGVHSDEILVFGHTHNPFLDENALVANSGSWIKNSSGIDYNTYIEIDDDSLKLKKFGHTEPLQELNLQRLRDKLKLTQ